jgi:hypothetical protein
MLHRSIASEISATQKQPEDDSLPLRKAQENQSAGLATT